MEHPVTSVSVPEVAPERRTAVIVSEMQCGIVDPELSRLPGLASHVASRHVIERIDRLVRTARDAGVLVVWSLIAPRPDRVGTGRNSPLSSLLHRWPFTVGTESAALAPGLTIDDRDVVIARVTGLTPFHGTDLDSILRVERVETVILTGVSTDVALTGGALEAVNRGYQVVLPVDCTAGSSEERHSSRIDEFFTLMGTVTTSDAILQTLDHGR